jgi:hypothetical protein
MDNRELQLQHGLTQAPWDCLAYRMQIDCWRTISRWMRICCCTVCWCINPLCEEIYLGALQEAEDGKVKTQDLHNFILLHVILNRSARFFVVFNFIHFVCLSLFFANFRTLLCWLH